MTKLLSLAAFATMLLTGTVLAAPNVVASTKPIHSLVTAVMGDVAAPILIVKGAASPHTYSLRPSDAAALESADIVFWTGNGFELFLADALKTLSTKAQIVAFADTPGLQLLPMREGGAFEAHDHDHASETAEEHAAHAHEDAHAHDHAHDHGTHGGEDLHFWLDPQNAILMVDYIETTLVAADPDNAATYVANAQTTRAALEALTVELATQLAPISGKPFVVFHDAYQYFEQRFDLTLAGTVTVSPDVAPGAARIDELRQKVAQLGATCVFAEPNFEPAVVRVIVEGSAAKSGVLDPEGSALSEGPDLYPAMLRSIATGLVDCLT
ncbi:zinc ABC transporter substrate-binding protein [Devosia sp. MC532]|uniref:zinc ABC transporter substrate-binding protein n=1 Tax=Devosia sp. MC532 TaxID=2799788 RepID=UPI0018F6B292|nr:zinc ABC transporter substrate-binding protein [Devosia sp. MC532]MBJ7577517.1 zinc ABC transporter substrate-binding protein [Devosia sp. MC532]